MVETQSKRSNAEQPNRPGMVARALMGLGGLGLLAGIGIGVFSYLSLPASDTVRGVAEESAQSATRIIDRVYGHLGHPAVLERARNALAGDAGAVIEAMESELNGRGVQNIVDLRVFPPRTEDIETGSYPEPDFGVIQMLIEAKRQGTASAQVHYSGTPNENLAFALAVPGRGIDAPVGVIFLRLPAGIVTNQLTSPGEKAWLRMTQGSRVVALRPANADLPDRGGNRVPVESSELVVEWGILHGTGVMSVNGGLAVAGIGLALMLVSTGLNKRAAKALARRRRRTIRDSLDEARGQERRTAAPARQPAAAEKARETPRAPEPEKQPEPAQTSPAREAADEPKPDLPDWLVDKSGSDAAAEIFGGGGSPGSGEDSTGADDEKAEAEVPEADLGMDVPDLDEILEQIDEKPREKPGEAPPPEPDLDFNPADSEEASDGDDDEFEAKSATEDLPEDSTADPELTSGPDGSSEPEPDLNPELGSELELEPEWGSEAESASETEKEAETSSESASDSGLDLGPELDLTADSEPERESGTTPEPEPEIEPESESEPEVASAPEQEPEPALTPQDESALDPEPAFSLDSALFLDDEIRGVVDESLDPEAATLIGRAIGTLASQHGLKRFSVARDGRVSGPVLLSALIRGLRNSGMDVVEVGAVPTPLLWFAAVELTDGCGVMVTGSHHPPEENGFRVMLGGELADRARMAEIAEVIRTGAFSDGEGGYEQEDVADRYATRFSGEVQLERALKVVIDGGHGIVGSAAPALFEAIGAEVIPLYCDVDGSFPNHPPDPSVKENLEDLRLCVRNFQADVGIAFDGDGDRLTVVANDGRVAWTDRQLMLLAQSILADKPDGTVVFDVRSSAHLKRLVEDAGGRAVMSPTGAGNVARTMREEGAVLAGDMKGHVFVADRWYGYDDAIYAGARLLELLAADSRNVGEVFAELPEFRSTDEMLIAVDAERGRHLIERLPVEADFGEATITTVDGVRVDHADRWGLVRMQPDSGELFVRFGADDTSGLSRIRGELKEQLLAIDPDLPLPY